MSTIKRFIVICFAVMLCACYTPPVKKEGIAIGVEKSDKSKAAAAGTGAVVGGVVAGAAFGPAGVVASTAMSAIGAVTGAVAGWAGAFRAGYINWCDLGGWAKFTFKSQENEIRVVDQPMSWVCRLVPGDHIIYLEDEAGSVMVKGKKP